MKGLAEIITGQGRITPTDPEEQNALSNFEFWVNKTAKLIGRSYIATFKLVKDWPDHKIERRYKEALDCGPGITPTIKWWWLRKREILNEEIAFLAFLMIFRPDVWRALEQAAEAN